MTPDRDLARRLEEWLEDAPSSAPPMSRATIRGRVRETRQRPWWLVRERGDPFERRRGRDLRLLAVGLVLLGLLGGSLGLASLGGRGLHSAPASPEITSFSVQGQPLGIAVEAGAVWAAMFDVGRVTRIDPVTGATTNIDSFGRNCVGISSGAGAVWVSTCQAGPLKRIDPATNTSSVVRLEGKGQVAAPVPFEGDIAWITIDVDRGEYVRYDGRAGQELSRGRLDGPGHVMSAAFGAGWATYAQPWGAREVLRIDATTLATTATIETELPPFYAAPFAGAMWVTTGFEGTNRGVLARIDPATNAIVATIELASSDVWPATDGSSLWLLDGRPPARLLRVDPGTSSIAETIVIGGRADTAAVDGDTIWVTRVEAREVVRVRTRG